MSYYDISIEERSGVHVGLLRGERSIIGPRLATHPVSALPVGELHKGTNSAFN